MYLDKIRPSQALSGATIPNLRRPGSDSNEGVLCIPQSPRITGTFDCFVSYLGHSLRGGPYPSAEEQLVYSIAPAHWATLILTFKEAPPDNDAQTFRFGYGIFLGLYIVAIPNIEVDYYPCSCHRCEKVLLRVREHLSRSQKILWCVKVQWSLQKNPVPLTSSFVTLAAACSLGWLITDKPNPFFGFRQCPIFAF